jgi:hypothetical protein
LKLSQGEVYDFSGEVQKFSGELQNDLREGAHLLHTSPQNPAMIIKQMHIAGIEACR